MKYLILFIIALGCVLNVVIGLEYHCEQPQDVWPEYFASPFIFKYTSLGSSMEFFYSIWGLLLNTLIWVALLSVLDLGVRRAIRFAANLRLLRWTYRTAVTLLLLVSTLSIAFHTMYVGRGFNPYLNFWYWDPIGEAKEQGASCEAELVFFRP